jgi:uncharacterized protein (TIGR02145 family)
MKNTVRIYQIIILILIAEKSFTQLGISATNTPPNTSAMLDVSSTSKGLLIPRMTTSQRTGIATPAQGLNVFDTQTKSFWYFDGLVWKEMNSNAITSLPYYPSVTICCQSWMTKNLNVTTYRNGDPIPQVTDPTAWAALTTGAWCHTSNNSANGPIYGKLYNWYAVKDPRGLAPEGWHIPTNFEWTTLINCLGGFAVAGGPLKEMGNTHWIGANTGATNDSGFTGLPSGLRYPDGSFETTGNYCVWWSSTDVNVYNAFYRFLDTMVASVSASNYPKEHGFSVRCIKD